VAVVLARLLTDDAAFIGSVSALTAVRCERAPDYQHVIDPGGPPTGRQSRDQTNRERIFTVHNQGEMGEHQQRSDLRP
jgi:hypothetical protein